MKTVNDEFPGWSMEPEVGGEPWVVTKGVPIGAEIAIGDNIRATIDILSNRVDKRRTIEGGDAEQFSRRRRNIQTSSRLWADGFSQRMASTWKSMARRSFAMRHRSPSRITTISRKGKYRGVSVEALNRQPDGM